VNHPLGENAFGDHVRRARTARRLIVQPRMGMSDPGEMLAGLLATRRARAATVGTITLDSYTRTGAITAAGRALLEGTPLNGYPIINHERSTTRELVEQARRADFPIQVRHGSPDPRAIFAAMAEIGLDASEGGPISYCLPYSRVPLRESVRYWAEGCEQLAAAAAPGTRPHLETFGGCLLGQLCPPSLLVAVSVLEGLFFLRHGVNDLSLSYAQQTNPVQDLEALAALHALAAEHLPGADVHIVLYTYMGLFPSTTQGALAVLNDSARIAVQGGAARLIVKTAAESYRLPTVAENITALEAAAAAAHAAPPPAPATPPISAAATAIHDEARTLIEAVLDLASDLDRALVNAFQRGILDVPYCLHPDNAGDTRCRLDLDGRLVWSATGATPLPAGNPARSRPRPAGEDAPTSAALLADLAYLAGKYDDAATAHDPARA
jgi:methylaspartate mutase epsilon subunit